MAKKIFIGNYKGGVGKTTSTYNIGGILRERGNKVLLLDLDPQSSLSDIAMAKIGDEAFINLRDEETLNYVFDIFCQARNMGINEFKINIEELIKDNTIVEFIPSSLLYKNGGLDKLCMKMGLEIKSVLILKQFIDTHKLDELYDYILFDCPPSNNIITQSAFMTSDYYIIPTVMDAISTKGVAHYNKTVEKTYDNFINKNKDAEEVLKLFLGDKPKSLGVFEARKKGNNNTNKYRDLLAIDNFIYNTIIGDIKDVTEMLGMGELSTNNHYNLLVDEIVNRLNEI